MQKKKKKHNLDFQTDVYAAYNKRIKITDQFKNNKR